MKWIFAVLMFGSLAVGVNAQSQWVEVIAVRANLRGTPDTNGPIVAEVEMGDRFRLLSQKGAWFLVQTSKYTGWLNGSTIRFVEPTRPNSRSESASPPPGYIRSPDIPDKFVPTPDSVRVETLASEKDHGYDIGFITLSGVYLRESASKNATVLKKFLEGDLVVLLERTKSNDWLHVADVETGKDGWVFLSHLKIYLTSEPKVTVPEFQSTYVDSDHDPEVTVKNDSDRKMTLKVAGVTYEVEAYSSRTIYLVAGTYKFFVSAPRAYPLYGDETFSKGHDYKWTFWIEKRVIP